MFGDTRWRKVGQYKELILEALDREDELSERDGEFINSLAEMEENDPISNAQAGWLDDIQTKLDGG